MPRLSVLRSGLCSVFRRDAPKPGMTELKFVVLSLSWSYHARFSLIDLQVPPNLWPLIMQLLQCSFWIMEILMQESSHQWPGDTVKYYLVDLRYPGVSLSLAHPLIPSSKHQPRLGTVGLLSHLCLAMSDPFPAPACTGREWWCSICSVKS